MMNVMAGFDARDSTSLERPREDYGRSLNRDLRGLRIGLPREYFGDGIDPGVPRTGVEGARWCEGPRARGDPNHPRATSPPPRTPRAKNCRAHACTTTTSSAPTSPS